MRLRPGRALLLLALLTASLAGAGGGFRLPPASGDTTFTVTPGAAQVLYLNGVPHTDASGRARTTYDPNASFLPIGIYHLVPCSVSLDLSWPAAGPGSQAYRLLVALDPGSQPAHDRVVADMQVTGTSATVANAPAGIDLWYSVFPGAAAAPSTSAPVHTPSCPAGLPADPSATLANAGFNVALPWAGPSLPVLVGRAAAAGLRLVADLASASGQTVDTYLGDPRVYGWYMADEPLMWARLAGIDPAGPYGNLGLVCYVFCGKNDQVFFLTEWPLLGDPWWPRFIDLGEAGSHDDYIRAASGLPTLRPIADSVTAQTKALGQGKPSWFVAQAFGGGPFGLPTPTEMRGMVYTALIHGATGVYQFAWDSFVLRGTGSLGIAPQPPSTYGSDSFRPTDSQLAASKALWDSLDASRGGLNAELEALRPVILSPGSPEGYAVAVSRSLPNGAPVRALLKKYNGHYYLLTVNLDPTPTDARISFGRAIEGLQPMFETASAAVARRTVLSDHFGPFQAHVYRLDLRCPDVTGDGWVNMMDVVVLFKAATGGGAPPSPVADVNADGAVTLADVVAALRLNGQSCP